jgi:hypothetical protein
MMVVLSSFHEPILSDDQSAWAKARAKQSQRIGILLLCTFELLAMNGISTDCTENYSIEKEKYPIRRNRK